MALDELKPYYTIRFRAEFLSVLPKIMRSKKQIRTTFRVQLQTKCAVVPNYKGLQQIQNNIVKQ